MTAGAAFFEHGEEYPAEICSAVPRKSCCSSCAFSRSPASVRPPGISIRQVEVWTCLDDDFICHQPSEDGLHHTCAAWFARFGSEPSEIIQSYQRGAK